MCVRILEKKTTGATVAGVVYVRGKNDGNNKRACAAAEPYYHDGISGVAGTGNSNTRTPSSSSHTRYGRTVIYHHYTARSRCTVYRAYRVHTLYVWQCSGAPDFRSVERGGPLVVRSSPAI